MKKLLDKYGIMAGLVTVVIMVGTFIISAGEAIKQVEQFEAKNGQYEKTFERIAAIADDLADPNTWLRGWLVNHGVDTVVAKRWSVIQKGPLVIDGDTIPGVTYLDNLPTKKGGAYPDIGIRQIRNDDGTVRVLDTLWNFRKVKDE